MIRYSINPLNNKEMKATFYLVNDLPSFYYIFVYDDGNRWELQLRDGLSHSLCDSFNLEYRVNLSAIDEIWYTHKVIKCQFDRDDWNADASDESIENIKAGCRAQNQMSLEEFVTDHNIEHIKYHRVMHDAIDRSPVDIEDYNWGV